MQVKNLNIVLYFPAFRSLLLFPLTEEEQGEEEVRGGLKLSTEREEKKPSRFIVRKRQQDNVVRADKTDPILPVAPSNLMSGRGVR